jgi:Immunity protein 8
MTKAVLRRLHSPDAPDMSSYVPEDPDRFAILVQAMIGPEGDEGEESFDFLVCTPEWLADRVADEGHEFGRHHLIVARYDPELINRALHELCETATGEWSAVATYLARYGKWEFEDYDLRSG